MHKINRDCRSFVCFPPPESAVGVEIVAPTEGGQLQREKRSILLAKTLAFGKGLLIGKVAGIALG